MAIVQKSPGIAIVEKDLTTRVPIVSTSNGAFAGVFKWGPCEQPVLVTSESQLVSQYGKPTEESAQWFFTAANFLKYSKNLYVTRINTGDSKNAVALKTGRITGVTVSSELPGSGYTAVPDVILPAPAAPNGVQATGVAVLTGGAIVGDGTIVDGGSGYIVGDTITLRQPEVKVDVTDPTTGIVTQQFIRAVAKITSVDGDGAVDGISFEVGGEQGFTRGGGYINEATLNTSTATIDSDAGTGLNVTFQCATSGIRSVTITAGGSGYTEDQPLEVSFRANQEGTAPTQPYAVATVVATGNKVINRSNYDASWSNGRSTFGEFAAKYPGATGNSLTVSMCDSGNWLKPVNGLFTSRKSVETRESTRELAQVRRTLLNETSFSNTELDANKVLRDANTGEYIGEVDSIDEKLYRKVTLAPLSGTDITYYVELDQPVYVTGYLEEVGTKQITTIKRNDGIVTVTTSASHGFVVGDYVSVNVSTTNTLYQSINTINAIITAVPNGTSFVYETENYADILGAGSSAVSAAGTVTSNGMGKIDGFIKSFNEDTDRFDLSSTEFYVTLNNASRNTQFDSGKVLYDANNVAIGQIIDVQEVQTVQLKAPCKYDTYGSTYTSEWKYKSYFGNNAPTTSAYATREGGLNDEIHVVVVDRDGLISGTPGTVLEKFADLSKASDAINLSSKKSIYYKNVLNDNSAWVWSLGHPEQLEDDIYVSVTTDVSYGSDPTEATVGSNAGLVVGQLLKNNPNLAANTSITAIDGNTITLSQAAIASGRKTTLATSPVNKTPWGEVVSGANFKNLTNALFRDLSGGVESKSASQSDVVNSYNLYNDKSRYDISLLPVGYVPAATANQIIANVVETRKDCVAFFSAPLYVGTADSIANSIVAYRNQLTSSSYAVLDSSWHYQQDGYNGGKFRWVPLAGHTAGLCAYTDEVADSWYSPGGFNRGVLKDIVKIAYNPTLAQRDILYPAGVNPVVSFPGEGTILYGDKTLQKKESAFDRINVRRLFIVLEKTISIAAKYQLFEFNDEFTRAQFRSLVEPYLRDVQGRRGIVEFLVKCDTSNNTPDIIDSNQFVADIYIKPNRSINYITLNFVATKTGTNFNELV